MLSAWVAAAVLLSATAALAEDRLAGPATSGTSRMTEAGTSANGLESGQTSGLAGTPIVDQVTAYPTAVHPGQKISVMAQVILASTSVQPEVQVVFGGQSTRMGYSGGSGRQQYYRAVFAAPHTDEEKTAAAVITVRVPGGPVVEARTDPITLSPGAAAPPRSKVPRQFRSST
ncbi:hypothetical protein ACFFMN_34715 [Planobispora siamensis]|uniref:hypothetical protein n=1 Tax=Planobispora siamensis TaxID=936338 RepID=UPI00194EDF9A|nr:hypothetical protein [Planobispora siamensis]